ncbi:MAG: hypothetical protein P8Y54_13560, partial [Xanthomonadales bacterium]
YFTDQGTGKIMWSERSWDYSVGGITPSKIYMLEFHVDAGAITDPFPLAPRVLLEEPVDFGNIYDPDLSPDGEKFIVSAYESGETEGYIWEFDIPDSGPVAIGAGREVAHLVTNDQGLEQATFYGPLYGLSDQRKRVYFGFDYPDRKFAFVEELPDGSWSAPVLVAERAEGDISPGSIGLWDFGDGLKEVMALSRSTGGNGAIEILDIDSCVDNPGADGCVVLDNIVGWRSASFTTITDDGPLPAMLYLFDVDARNVGYSIRECKLDIAYLSDNECYRTVIDGIKNPQRTLYGVDSAD